MLFKYLIGTIALATSVMSSPAEEALIVPVRSEHFDKCVNKIGEFQTPLNAACEAEKVEDVKGHLKKIYQPFEELSAHFKSSMKIEEKLVAGHTKKFIEVLKVFETVLVVIHRHPKVSTGCKDVFIEFDYSFESISTVFRKNGVDIYKKIQESSLQIHIWESLGFRFPTHQY